MKILLLLFLFPFYFVAFILSFIFMITLSLVHMVVDQVFFNPLKFGWYHFSGKKYNFDFEKDFLLMVASVIFFACLCLFVYFFIVEWKICLFILSIIFFIRVSFKLGNDFLKIIYDYIDRKKEKDENKEL